MALLTGYSFNVTGIEEGDYELQIDNNGRKLDIYQFILNKDNPNFNHTK